MFGVRPRVGSERTTHRFEGLDLDRKTCKSGAFFTILLLSVASSLRKQKEAGIFILRKNKKGKMDFW